MKPQAKNILAMTAFGTISVFVRNIALSSMEIAFWRGAIALVVLWLMRKIVYRGNADPVSRRQKGLLLLSGMAVGLNWAFFFLAYEYTSVSVATLAYYFAPVIVIVLSPVLFQEKMTLLQLACFVMATVGLVMVIGTGEPAGSNPMLGIGYGLTAAAFYASVILMNKAVPSVSGLDRTFLQFIGAAGLLFVVVILRGGFAVFQASLSSVVNLLAVGVFHTGLCYWLYFSSIKELPGQQTAILSYIDPFVAILVSVFVFGEPIGLSQGIGTGLILGFTCLYEVGKSRGAEKKHNS